MTDKSNAKYSSLMGWNEFDRESKISKFHSILANIPLGLVSTFYSPSGSLTLFQIADLSKGQFG